MKLTNLTLSFLLTALPFHNANAVDVDPLWSKVIVQNNEAKKWAAKNVEQTIISTKDGDPSKTVNIKKQFSGWEKNKAQYIILSITPPPADPSKSSKAFDFSDIFAPIESEIFSQQASVKRTDRQVLNGKTVVLFEVSRSDTLVRIWADETSGAIQKRVVEMKIPFTLEGFHSTNYHVDINGQSLPTDAETKLNITVPFKKTKLEIKDSYSNWITQP